MDRSRFQERVKLINIDLNALHELTEAALAELIEAMSGGLNTLLFDNAPHTYVVIPTVDVTINVPAQRFAAGGVVGEVAAQSFVKPDPLADVQYNIFFVVGRTDVTANRDRLDLGPPLAVVVDNVVIKDETSSRIEVTTAAMPSMGPTDIDYVQLGSVQKVLGIWSMTHNTASVYVFPGITPSGPPHAITHITAGLDMIQLADVTGKVGLMPPNTFQFLKEALQWVDIAPGSECLVRVHSGDNTPGTPKRVTLSLRSSDSFRLVDVGGSPGLGLNFASGPYAGASNKPARWDHAHSPSESPIAVLTEKVTVGPSNLGLLLPEITFSGIARIYQTQVFWGKPGTGSPDYPIVPCGWFDTASGFVGAQAIVTGNNKVRVQAGGRAWTHMIADTVALLGGVGWQYSDDLGYPTDGELFVRVMGIR